MKVSKAVIYAIIVLLFILAGGTGHLCATPFMDCTVPAFEALNLKDIAFNDDVVFTSAAITSSATVPEHCLVEGIIWPEIEFAVRLPIEWNGKLRHTGGGGFDGFIPDTSDSVILGYAAISTNGGHTATDYLTDPALFAYNPPDNSNPNAAQKVVDFGTRAHHEGAVLAKVLVNAYYGTDPSRSYWIGCSNGGREGLMMAQRFPDLFDGYLIGAPVANFSGECLHLVWNAQTLYDKNWLVLNKLPLLAAKVYNKCDGLDGIVDGIIDDPRKCIFDLTKDLPRCWGIGVHDHEYNSTCFTTGQMEILKKIYTGVHVSGPAGDFTYLGVPFGSEYMLNGASGWTPSIAMAQNAVHPFGESFLKYMAFEPAGGPDYDWRTFNFTRNVDPLRVVASGIVEKIDAQDPNLLPAKLHGAKIIQYHGWADPTVVPAQSYGYYETVLSSVGDQATKEFYKLYMIPGMGHCGGGLGAFNGTTDLAAVFDALVDWVESGAEPDTLIGTREANGDLTYRTRPLCPYPQVARYLGSGSIDDAANFTCVTLVPAQLDITQKKVKLGKGTFTAKMTIPAGCSFTSKGEISPVVSEGALGKIKSFSKTKKGTTFTTKFNVDDTIGIAAGDAVTFTVTAIFEQGGKTYAFEGSDTLKVLAK